MTYSDMFYFSQQMQRYNLYNRDLLLSDASFFIIIEVCSIDSYSISRGMSFEFSYNSIIIHRPNHIANFSWKTEYIFLVLKIIYKQVSINKD